MKKNEIQEKFLDLIEHTLSEDEERELLSELEKDPELGQAFRAYEKVVSIEHSIAQEEYQAGPQFAVKVMDRIEEDSVGFLELLFMSWKKNQRVISSSLALTATVMIVFLMSQKIPEQDYRMSSPVAKAPEAGQDAGNKVVDTSSSASESQTQPESAKEVSTKERDGVADELAEAPPPPVKSEASQKLAQPAEQKPAAIGFQNELKRMEEVRDSLNSQAGEAIDQPAESVAAQEKFKEKASSVAADAERQSGGGNLPQRGQQAPKGYAKTDSNLASKNDKGVLSDFDMVAGAQFDSSKDQKRAPVDAAQSGFAAPAPKGKANEEQEAAPASRARRELESLPSYKKAVRPSVIAPGVNGGALGNIEEGLIARSDDSVAGATAVAPEPRRHLMIQPLPPPPTMPVILDPQAGNYKGYEEQPRIRTAEEALSTFSVDVDTASYTNARRYLQAGNLPPAASVRIEEFINYFDYQYPSQSEQPFSMNYEIAPSPLEKDRLLLKVGIKARDAKAERKPWNLVFLVDTSGSMSPADRLGLIQKGLQAMVSEMKPEDKVALVTYAGSAGLVLDSTPAKESAKILNAIRNLSSGGSTNGSGGIELAYQVAERNMINNGVNRVVLATDGDFNVGVTSESELNTLIEKKRKSGITLTTLGVGTGNFKDARLEQLADKGNGNYFYLDSFQEARRVLVDKIGSTVEVVAKDVKLQIEFNPQHVAQYRLIGYDNRKLAKEDFNNDAIDAGEIGVGHTVTAIYEVILTNTDLAKKLDTEYRYQKKVAVTETPNAELPSEMAFLKIRYKEPEANNSKLLEFPIEVAQVKSSADSASVDFRFASAVAYFGTLLRESKFIGSYGYHDVAELAARSLGEDTDGARREFLNLVKNAEASAKVGTRGAED